MTEIEVKNLCKTINKNMVLDNINLHMVSGAGLWFSRDKWIG